MSDDRADDPLSDVARRVASGRDDADPADAADPERTDVTETDPADLTETDPADLTETDPADLTDLDGRGDAGASAERSAPLSDLARRVAERESAGVAAAEDDSPFELVSVGEPDAEEVWDRLAADDEGGVGTAEAATPVGEGRSGREDHVVSKASFCQRCPHIADPPELACTHPGTEIVEIVDSERFRVRNCPMVDEE